MSDWFNDAMAKRFLEFEQSFLEFEQKSINASFEKVLDHFEKKYDNVDALNWNAPIEFYLDEAADLDHLVGPDARGPGGAVYMTTYDLGSVRPYQGEPADSTDYTHVPGGRNGKAWKDEQMRRSMIQDLAMTEVTKDDKGHLLGAKFSVKAKMT